jgi:hypothetical protein
MERKNIITIVKPTVETFGNFKKLCEIKNLPYHSLKGEKFPIIYEEFEIHKTKLQ